jgi:ABC-type methionine transport system permease subunit
VSAEGRAAKLVCIVLIGLEVAGIAFMFAFVPFAWFWVGKQVGAATASIGAAIGVTFFGFVGTVVLNARLLQRIDHLWIELRRRAGYDQAQGVLTQVIVVSTTLALIAFFAWYYLLSKAFILPFMPRQ